MEGQRMCSQSLRRGYTTGTCAQAATKAAMLLLFGISKADELTDVRVELPKGERLNLEIRDIKIEYKKRRSFQILFPAL